MGSTVQVLDKSGWSPAAMRREKTIQRDITSARARRVWEASPEGIAYLRAVADHPLQDVLANISDEEVQASRDHAKWLFKSWDAGNGLREAFAARKRVDPRATIERAIKRDLAWMVPRGLGDRSKSIANAAQRAKQEVRRLCKTMRVNALWTLTYRANVQDREIVLKHFDAFRRRVVALLGGWRYVAVIETQERGALHIHLATNALPVYLRDGGVRVKSWDVMRRIWRSVVGELGGNFDEAKRKHWWRPNAKHARDCGAIASYIAGYVAKDMLEGELNRKRYSASRGVEVPECYRAEFEADEGTMLSLVELCYSAMDGRVTRSWFDRTRQVFYVESDDGGGSSG